MAYPNEHKSAQLTLKAASHMKKLLKNCRYLCMRVLFCDLWILISTAFGLYLMNKLCQDSLPKIIAYDLITLFDNFEQRSDVLSQVFPQNFECQLQYRDVNGLLVQLSTQCVFPANDVFEKIFLFSWIFGFLATCVSFLDIILTFGCYFSKF